MASSRVQHLPNPQTGPVSPGSGEFLFFALGADGPLPKFRLASDQKGTLLHQGIFPQDPSTMYEWTYLRDPSDIQQFEILTIGILFAGNARYRYRVNVHGPTGLLRPVLDIEYTGTPADFDDESFRILIV